MTEGRSRIATTINGKDLAFDGTGDVGYFHREFVRSMKEFQLGTIVNYGDHGIPLKPEDAFYRASIQDWTNPRDFGNISTYNRNYVEYTDKCEVVLASYKKALSESVKQHLEGRLPHEYNNASKPNFEALKAEVVRYYWGWSDTKGEMNYKAMKAIPVFRDVKSVDYGLKMLQRLRLEREG